MGLQTVEEDGAVGGIFRGVREEILESNLPRLWIFIMQELEKLDLSLEEKEEREW
jgi:hypothetical protein